MAQPAYPTGETGDLTITLNGSAGTTWNYYFALYRMIGLRAADPLSTNADGYSSGHANLAADLDLTKKGGFMFAAGMSSSSSVSLTGSVMTVDAIMQTNAGGDNVLFGHGMTDGTPATIRMGTVSTYYPRAALVAAAMR